MGKAWRSLHMNKTRIRERMCITAIRNLRHTWTQEGLPITWSLEFFDLQTNSDSSTMVLKSPSVKFYKNPFSRFPVITCVKTDWQIKKTVIVASPNVKAHTVYPRFSQSLLWTAYIFSKAIFPSSLNRKTACSSEKLLPTYRGHSDIRLKNTILIKIQQFVPKSQNFLSSACY